MENKSGASFYRIVTQASALLFLVLALFLSIAPRAFLAGLGLDLTLSTDFLCRRAAVLLSGLSVLCFCGRNAPHSPARQALAMSMVATTGLIAALGVAEFLRGATTAGIFKPVATETTVAVCFLIVWLRGRAADRSSQK
jgi:hypothetical protein